MYHSYIANIFLLLCAAIVLLPNVQSAPVKTNANTANDLPENNAPDASQDETVLDETAPDPALEGPQSRSLMPTPVMPSSMKQQAPLARTVSNDETFTSMKSRMPATTVSYFDYLASPNSYAQTKATVPQPYSAALLSSAVTPSPLRITTKNNAAIEETISEATPQAAAQKKAPSSSQQKPSQQQLVASASGYDAVSYGDGPLTYQVPVYVHKEEHDDTYRTLLELFQRKVHDQAGEIVSTTGMVVKNALKTQELSKSKFDQLLPYMLAMGAMFAFSGNNSG